MRRHGAPLRVETVEPRVKRYNVGNDGNPVRIAKRRRKIGSAKAVLPRASREPCQRSPEHARARRK